MFFFCIGLPSRFGEWCAAVLTRLVERTLGTPEAIYADIFEQFLVPAIRSESPSAIVSSFQISGPLWAALAEANKPFLLICDHPHHALENIVERHGAEFLEATRVIAKSCASLVSCAALPGALVLRAERDAADLLATAAAIARHLGFAVDDAGIADVVAAVADFDPRRDPQEHLAWWRQLDAAQRALVTGAVDPYLTHLAGGDLGQIVWERDFFYMNEEPPSETDPPAARPIDITGRPRHLLYGPYITLPPGSWSATVALGFSAEATELSYLVQVYAGVETLLCSVTLPPGQERVVETTLNFSLAAPDMIDNRVCNERAAFDGRLALGHVVVTQVGGIRAQTRSYLETAVSG